MLSPQSMPQLIFLPWKELKRKRRLLWGIIFWKIFEKLLWNWEGIHLQDSYLILNIDECIKSMQKCMRDSSTACRLHNMCQGARIILYKIMFYWYQAIMIFLCFIRVALLSVCLGYNNSFWWGLRADIRLRGTFCCSVTGQWIGFGPEEH